jgi:hypothetical protein
MSEKKILRAADLPKETVDIFRRACGIRADEFEFMSFAFDAPRRGQKGYIKVDAACKPVVEKLAKDILGMDIRIPHDGKLRMFCEKKLVAKLDDDYQTRIYPASNLFMAPRPEKAYNFVVAMVYSDDRTSRRGYALYASTDGLDADEWINPFPSCRQRDQAVFFPVGFRRGADGQELPVVEALHPCGKKIVVGKDIVTQPKTGRAVPVELRETVNFMIAEPLTMLITEKPSEKEIAFLRDAIDDGLPPEDVPLPSGAVKKVWHLLTEFTNGSLKFAPDMTRKDFLSKVKKGRVKFHPDKKIAEAIALWQSDPNNPTYVGYCSLLQERATRWVTYTTRMERYLNNRDQVVDDEESPKKPARRQGRKAAAREAQPNAKPGNGEPLAN